MFWFILLLILLYILFIDNSLGDQHINTKVKVRFVVKDFIRNKSDPCDIIEWLMYFFKKST